MASSTQPSTSVVFCGRKFPPRELRLIAEVVDTFGGLSRLELARTVCELVGWRRASGGLKARECLDLLEALEERGYVRLRYCPGMLCLPLRPKGPELGDEDRLRD